MLFRSNSYPKWTKRTRVGVYLGQSPQHARSVSLILSLQTGCVSPQFHCVVDSNFETTQPLLHQEPLPESLWQVKCHIKRTSCASTQAPQTDIPSAEGAAALPDASGNLDSSLLDSDALAQSLGDGQMHTHAPADSSASQMEQSTPVNASADRLQQEYRYPKRI